MLILLCSGSILTVTTSDIYIIAFLSIISLLTLFILYDKLIYIAYDEDTSKIIGVKVRLIQYIFSILVASAIAISIRIVGVLVLGSLISIPVATALQFKKGFKKTLIISIIFSFIDIMLRSYPFILSKCCSKPDLLLCFQL